MTSDAGFELAFKADALWVGTRTDAATGTSGNLKATSAAVTRIRTALEGSKSTTIGARMALTPSVELGIRHDGGDAEVGRGLDLGLGLVVADGFTPGWPSTSACAGCWCTKPKASPRRRCRSR